MIKMKAKMIALMMLSMGVMIGGTSLSGGSCQSSYDCSVGFPCCVDNDGKAIVINEGPHSDNLESQGSGTCKSYIDTEDDVCDDSCKCGTGLVCYREMSGFYQPRKCKSATWVQEEEKRWKDCEPNCLYPP